MNHQLIIPIIIPVFGLDGAGKTLLCRQLAAANDQNGHTTSSAHQLSSLFIPSSASHLLVPQQQHHHHQQNQPLLPFTTYPNFTKERLVHHHFSDPGKKESKQEENKSLSEKVPTTMASPYQHRTTEMFTPPSATPQNRGALAIAGSNISSSSRPPSAVAAAADENPNFIPDSSPEKRRDETDDDSHVLAAASTTPRNRIQYHHQHENDDDNQVDLFSPRVVQTVMKSPETKHEHENDSDQHQGKHETMAITRSFVIHLLDTAGSPLLRGSWLPIMNQHVILSSNNHNVENDCDSVLNDHNTMTATKRFIFVINANDLMRVSFAWTEFLQFRDKVRKLTSTTTMKISAAVVLFDDDGDEEGSTKMNAKLFQQRVVSKFSIRESHDEVAFLDASVKDVSEVAKWLVGCF